jgi:hypothetical protein
MPLLGKSRTQALKAIASGYGRGAGRGGSQRRSGRRYLSSHCRQATMMPIHKATLKGSATIKPRTKANPLSWFDVAAHG